MLGGSMSRVAMEYARASEESHQLELQMWSPLADAPAPQTPAPSPPVTPRPGTSEGGRGGTPGTVTRRLYATPLQQEGGAPGAAQPERSSGGPFDDAMLPFGTVRAARGG